MRENDRNFFKPLWRRVAVLAVCIAWSAWEWSTGATTWGMLSGGMALYCIWSLFLNFKTDDETK